MQGFFFLAVIFFIKLFETNCHYVSAKSCLYLWSSRVIGICNPYLPQNSWQQLGLPLVQAEEKGILTYFHKIINW